MEPSDALSSYRRRVRLAGYAGVVWAALQLLILAVAGGENAWELRGLAINILPALLLTIFVLRGNLIAAIALGAYGIVRLVMAVFVAVRLINGTVAQYHAGLPWEIALVVVFALVWISGGLAAYHLLRRTDPSTSAAA